MSVKCWGRDLTDGAIGPWKSTYPKCILNDGNGGSNALFDGRLELDGDRNLCITMERLSSINIPFHVLAVGFEIGLKRGEFQDGNTTRTVEMTRFKLRPRNRSIKK